MARQPTLETKHAREPDESRSPGQPQDRTLDDAIVRAALAILADVGYQRLSIEEVARRAGTAKTSVYRRWPTKELLTLEAVRRYLGTIAITLGGAAPARTLRADLIAHIERLTTVLTRERIGVLAGLLLAIRTHRELAAMIRAELVRTEVTAMRGILERAAARREIAAVDRSALIFHLVPGVLFTRLFVLDQPMERALAAQIVDEVLLPLLTYDGPRRQGPARKRQSSRMA